jgi:hypothetical protein
VQTTGGSFISGCNLTGGNWHPACKLHAEVLFLVATKLAEIGTPRANYRRKFYFWVQLNWWKWAPRVQTTGGSFISGCNLTGGNWHPACKLHAEVLFLGATKLAEIGTPRANYRRKFYSWVQLNWRKLAPRVQTTGGSFISGCN